MKKILKKIIVCSGISRLAGMLSRQKVFCVGYHSIYNEKNKEKFNYGLYPHISISSEDFEEQIIFMKKNGHTFIHFFDLEKMDVSKVNKPTVIFFDDGFKDVLVNAMPILNKHGVKATVFITTGLIDRTHILWTLGLSYFLSELGFENGEIEEKIRELKKMKMKEREGKIAEMYREKNFILRPQDFNIFLDWEEVRQLADKGIEIASHGVSHQKLIELDDEVLEKELVESKKRIEEMTKVPVKTISYPYGRFNERVISAVEKAGYTLGMTGLPGLNNLERIKSKPLEIKRAKGPEPGDSLAEFGAMLYLNL